MNNSVLVGYTEVDELTAVQAVTFCLAYFKTKTLEQSPQCQIMHPFNMDDSRYWRYTVSIYSNPLPSWGSDQCGEENTNKNIQLVQMVISVRIGSEGVEE